MAVWWALGIGAILLAGCVGGGGNGGAVDSDANGSGPAGGHVAAAYGGAGTSGGPFSAGSNGCSVMVRGSNFTMCSTTFDLEGGTITIIAVNASAPMTWEMLGLAETAAGYVVAADGKQADFDRNTTVYAELPAGHSGTDYPEELGGPVYAADIGRIASGTIKVGQAVNVCGPVASTLWIWDSRPVGAVAALELRNLDCSGRPLPEVPAEPASHVFALQVTGPRGDLYGNFGKNCVNLPDGTPVSFDVNATWTAQSPLAATLQFALWQGTERRLVEAVNATSPFTHTFTSDGTAPLLVVLPPQTGAAMNQDVLLNVTARFQSRPNHLFPATAGSCPQG